MNFIIAWLPTTIVFFLLLGILVFVHELGHFIAARLSGMKVEEFAFGFPPKIWSKKYKGTKYAINLFPIGGYVKILGEDGDSKDKNAFGSKSIRARMFVLVAGVTMNFILAFLAIMVLFWVGLPPLVSTPEKYNGTVIEGSGGLYIESINADSLAQKYDFKIGDTIVSVDGVNVPRVGDLREQVAKNKGGKLSIELKRGNDILNKEIEIGDNSVLGVGLIEKVFHVSYSWWKVPYYALLETGRTLWAAVVAIINFFKNLIISHAVPADVVGPIGLFGITSVALSLGFGYILMLLILLTINLGIINILPFPALDGGRVVFLIAEKIRGKKVAEHVEGIINLIGFWLLIILMILVAVRDVMRL
ncbi:MAG: site-2 protease family protein [Patescibacteria group bacterium]|nr:site-2 protease family protein [Patescibacteria group bacterium]